MLEMKNEEIKQLRKEKMEKHLEVHICVPVDNYYITIMLLFPCSMHSPDEPNGTN